MNKIKNNICIIAECGINHSGDINYAKRSIDIAKQIGCHIWKTQLYDPNTLFPDHKIIVNNYNWYQEVEKTMLSFDQVRLLKDYCDKVGIEFLASAFDLKRLQWLEMLHVKRHKIATRMNTNNEYIDAVIATGKETLISMSSISGDKFINNIIPIYCIPKYPAMLSDLNLKSIGEFFDGFSDHTIGIDASLYALANGAKIIEKHFCLSRYDRGPDIIASVTPSEMARIVKFAKVCEVLDK